MRRRLRNFLPIVLMALAVQILAPIGACWAASIAASDPLHAAPICSGGAASTLDQTGQTGEHRAHDGACAMCCVAHAGASLDTPESDLRNADTAVRARGVARRRARPVQLPDRLARPGSSASVHFLTRTSRSVRPRRAGSYPLSRLATAPVSGFSYVSLSFASRAQLRPASCWPLPPPLFPFPPRLKPIRKVRFRPSPSTPLNKSAQWRPGRRSVTSRAPRG